MEKTDGNPSSSVQDPVVKEVNEATSPRTEGNSIEEEVHPPSTNNQPNPKNVANETQEVNNCSVPRAISSGLKIMHLKCGSGRKLVRVGPEPRKVPMRAMVTSGGGRTVNEGRRGGKRFDEFLDLLRRRLCRVCGLRRDVMFPIFEGEGTIDANGISLSTKVQMYLPPKLEQGDGLPTQICARCRYLVERWHELYTAQRAVQTMFQKMFGPKENETPQNQ